MIKIGDFGLSSLLDGDASKDQKILLPRRVGTVNYMAPEIVSSNDYSPAGDVWAFGCVLVHMGSGHTPYSHLKHLKEAKDYAQAKLDDQGAIDLLETSMQVL